MGGVWPGRARGAAGKSRPPHQSVRPESGQQPYFGFSSGCGGQLHEGCAQSALELGAASLRRAGGRWYVPRDVCQNSKTQQDSARPRLPTEGKKTLLSPQAARLSPTAHHRSLSGPFADTRNIIVLPLLKPSITVCTWIYLPCFAGAPCRFLPCSTWLCQPSTSCGHQPATERILTSASPRPYTFTHLHPPHQTPKTPSHHLPRH